MKMVNKLANDKMYENSSILNNKVKDLVFYCNRKSVSNSNDAILNINNINGNSDR